MSRGVVWMILTSVTAGVMTGAQATADVAYLDQQRTISVVTTGDGSTQAASAPNFAPFTGQVSLATTIPTADGPVVNAAGGRIDCQINPNSIVATGNLSGAGGSLQIGGPAAIGEAKALINITFEVQVPTPFSLSVSPRPAVHPSDSFELKIRNLDDHSDVIEMEETDPPRQVEMSGVLAPGTYLLRYSVEATFDDVPDARDYFLRFLINCRADINGANGVDMQDIFDFLALWFGGDARADFDGSGGLSADDIFEYLNGWFAGC